MDERFLECGRINNSHGLAGEVKFEIWTEPQYAKKLRVLYDEKGNSYEVEKRRFQGEDRMILKLKGIDTVEQAATLRTTVLYFNRDDIKLPKGSYFYADLIGMTVKDADNGRVYGTLAEVLALPASSSRSTSSKVVFLGILTTMDPLLEFTPIFIPPSIYKVPSST